ncbi:uncharacterized protein LOC107013375 [Solanum pennellii]|uniref:Uncharacterized protein LOC107013375 n=1 Tax=Solanum pennellii TaxID=28526 RepID=A0ABM1GBQ3_SOLPN|nr:uncharacterized protein LOC107013375 [Solanum pennellii]
MVGEAASRGNQVPSQAQVAADQVPVNLAGLIDGEVRNALLQMVQAITTQAQAITAQATREGAPRQNHHASTMASSRARGDVPITWNVLETAFLERFFPREQREAKVKEFINLRQGGMSVKEYSLRFVNLSKYDSSLVENSRDEISRFVTGVSEDLVEDYGVAMLHDSMDLGRLMVHAQKVEESRRKRRVHESKNPRTTDFAGPSLGRVSFAVQDNLCSRDIQVILLQEM